MSLTSNALGHRLLSRRQLMQAGGIGALAMASPGMVAASVNPGQGLRGVAAKRSCIFVLLCGGPIPIAPKFLARAHP